MSVKLLTEQHLEFLSLKGGFTGSSESASALVKIPHCWKSHVTAHIFLIQNQLFQKKFFQEHYLSVKQFGTRSGLMFCLC